MLLVLNSMTILKPAIFRCIFKLLKTATCTRKNEVDAVRQKILRLKINSFSINFLRGSKSTTGIEYEINTETALSLEQTGLYEGYLLSMSMHDSHEFG